MVLNTTEDQLRLCEHKIDITKTSRSLIKHIYPDANDRANMLISTMPSPQLKAIQGKHVLLDAEHSFLLVLDYARLAHPAQAKVPNALINNAIGNVFANDKRRLERQMMEEQLSSEITGVSNEESDCER